MILAYCNCPTYDFWVILSVRPPPALLAVAATTQSTYGTLSMATSVRPIGLTTTWTSWRRPIRCVSLLMARSSTADLIRQSGCSTQSALAGIASRGLLSVRDHTTPWVSALQRALHSTHPLLCGKCMRKRPAVPEMEWNDYLFVIILLWNSIRILVYKS